MNRKEFITSLGILGMSTVHDNLFSLEKLAQSLPKSERMPVLFIGHGSPMNAIEDNQFVRGFHEIAGTLPTPNAILCISAHWYTRGTQILSSVMPRTIYDFGGFPEALYQIQYPAHGDPKLAKELGTMTHSYHTTLSDDWGLDHGAWTVLMHLFPKANIPVIQMSIDYTQPASYHYELAMLLKSLRDKGILVIGSGNIIHNLGMIDWANMQTDNYGYDWAREVRTKTNDAIQDRNSDYLIQYLKHGTAFRNAVPTPDHYLPLIYAMALSDTKDDIVLFNDKLLAGSLSMTSVRWG